MAKILTSNVIITKDKNSISQLFSSDILDFKYFDHSKALVSPGKNKYLVSMEYEVNMESDTHKFLTLLFADVDGKFEIEYLQGNTDLMESLIRRNLAPRKFEDITSKDLALNFHDIIYIAFGNGDNIKDWSDVMCFDLRQADLEVRDGVRYFKFMYSPSNDILFRKTLEINDKEINPEREKEPFKNATSIIELSVPIEEDDPYSVILYKYYKEYLRKFCSTDDVILLIPEGIDEQIKTLASQQNKSPDVIFRETFFITKTQKITYDPSIQIDETVINRGVGIQDFLYQNDTMDNRSKTYHVNFQPDKSSQDDPKEVLDINFFEPINSLSFGIQKLLKIVSKDGFILVEEINSKFLKTFKQFGLIKSDDNRCVVAGLSKHLSETVYLNSFDIDSPSVLATIKNVKEKELESAAYKLAIKQLVKKKKHSSAFGEKILLDELMYSPEGQSKNRLIDPVVAQLVDKVTKLGETDTPVFVNNLKNSNVISIDLKNNNSSYLLALNYAVENDFINYLILNAESKWKETEEYNQTKTTVRSLIGKAKALFQIFKNLPPNTSTIKIGQIPEANDVLQFLLSNKQDVTNIKNIVSALVTVSSKKENVDSLIAILYKFFDSKDYLISLNDMYGRDSEEFRRAAIFQRLYTIGSIEMKVKTLPYFNLSDIRTFLYKYCILLSKKVVAQISPINSNLKELNNYFDYFSGIYNIIGFKHTISSNEMSSEFRLVKSTVETL